MPGKAQVPVAAFQSGAVGSATESLRSARAAPAGAAPGRAGSMAAVLAFRVVAGLVAAALTAMLLEYYGLAGQTSPLPQARVPRRPHPAPGPEASNIFWGLQVTLREPGEGGRGGGEGRLGAELAGLVRRRQFPRGAGPVPIQAPTSWRGWGWGRSFPGGGGFSVALHLCFFLPP